jgi:hypothetical protein
MQGTYTAYGLTFASTLHLPELSPVKAAAPDVVIRSGEVSRQEGPADEGGICFRHSTEESYLRWDPVGSFLVRAGNEILFDPAPGVEEPLLRLPLLGAVMAVLLHQRGFLVLHASAVRVDGEAVLFLGGKGWGKSTLAAALHARGHVLIADDVVALQLPIGETPMAVPGFPHCKLWPDAVAGVMGRDPDELPRLHSRSEKRSYTLSQLPSGGPEPLRRVYVLAQGERPETERLPPLEVLPFLLGHTYVARFGSQLLHGDGAAAHLRQCARVAATVPSYWLRRPRSLAVLPDLARTIEADREPARL